MFVKEVLDIAEELECPFDYNALVAECKKRGAQVPSSRNFAIAMGHAVIGRILFPETSSLYEAWDRHIKNPIISEEDRPCYVDQSKGFGDTVAKFTHAVGLDKVAEAYTRVTGRPCGCDKRQEFLNKVFPYESK